MNLWGLSAWKDAAVEFLQQKGPLVSQKPRSKQHPRALAKTPECRWRYFKSECMQEVMRRKGTRLAGQCSSFLGIPNTRES